MNQTIQTDHNFHIPVYVDDSLLEAKNLILIAQNKIRKINNDVEEIKFLTNKLNKE
jgi:hypothetical protein